MKNNKVKITPRGEYVLVIQDQAGSRQSEYGITIPETEEQEQKAIGTIISIGDSVKGLKVKDRVIFGAFLGDRVKMREDNKEVEYLLLKEEDILAFIND